MFYAGYYNREVAEMLPFLLKNCKINLKKVTKDFSSLQNLTITPNNDYIKFIQNHQFVLVPVNQYFQKKALSNAWKLVNSNKVVIFFQENDIETYVVFNNKQIHSIKLNHEAENYNLWKKIFLLPQTNNTLTPVEQALKEVLDNNTQKFNNYIKALKSQKFKNTVNSLFETIDATLQPHSKQQDIQKLIYILQFIKHPDEYMLRESFGKDNEDRKYLAEITAGKWKQVFNIELNSEMLYTKLDVESYGDINYLEDTIYKEASNR